MPQFKFGDRVERIGPLAPTWMSDGIVLRIILNESGLDWATEYDVEFNGHLRARLYETQLRLVRASQKELGGKL
jgi:hypothetical protein